MYSGVGKTRFSARNSNDIGGLPGAYLPLLHQLTFIHVSFDDF